MVLQRKINKAQEKTEMRFGVLKIRCSIQYSIVIQDDPKNSIHKIQPISKMYLFLLQSLFVFIAQLIYYIYCLPHDSFISCSSFQFINTLDNIFQHSHRKQESNIMSNSLVRVKNLMTYITFNVEFNNQYLKPIYHGLGSFRVVHIAKSLMIL